MPPRPLAPNVVGLWKAARTATRRDYRCWRGAINGALLDVGALVTGMTEPLHFERLGVVGMMRVKAITAADTLTGAPLTSVAPKRTTQHMAFANRLPEHEAGRTVLAPDGLRERTEFHAPAC